MPVQLIFLYHTLQKIIFLKFAVVYFKLYKAKTMKNMIRIHNIKIIQTFNVNNNVIFHCKYVPVFRVLFLLVMV